MLVKLQRFMIFLFFYLFISNCIETSKIQKTEKKNNLKSGNKLESKTGNEIQVNLQLTTEVQLQKEKDV
jgi:hypothetical protein